MSLLLLLLAMGCDDDAPPAPVRETSPEEAVREDPLEGLDEPARDEELAAPMPTGEIAAPDTLAGAPPDRGCVALTEAPTKVWAAEGPSSIAAYAAGFAVAGYARGDAGEELFVVHVSPGSAPRPLRRIRIEPGASTERIAPPAIVAAGGAKLFVGVIDGRGRVRVGEIDASDPLAEVRLAAIGESADQRFAPALAALTRHRLAAWTDGSGTPMRVRLAVLGLDGTVASRHDVTPVSMGASAPTFGAGMSPPVLFFLDARAGVSPIVRVPIAADGTPRPAEVARPVGTAATPPEIAVARGGAGTWAGYTAVGNAATTAVGWVPLDRDDASPSAIVPGTGYGTLHVSAASAPSAVLFAADAPKDAPPGSPREVHVRIVDADGAGPVLALRAPDGTARHGAIARSENGIAGVSMTADDGVYVAWVRCDDAR